MAAFASPEELATYLQTATEAEHLAGNPDALDTLRAQQLLDNASADIRSACGSWSITQETVTGQRVYPGQSGRIRIPTLRLTAFTMTINGVAAVDGTDYTWTLNGGGGVPVARTFAWSDVVLVTYTHGYATAPTDVREVCLEQAALRYANPSRLSSTTIGETSEVYGFRFGSSVEDLPKDPRLLPYKLPSGTA